MKVTIYDMQLSVYNKTDNVLYLDKEVSFAYLNGIPTCLFTNASYTNSATQNQGTSMNMGGLARALGVKGAAGSIMSGIDVSGGTSQGSSTTYYEQKIVTIAPKSAYIAYQWLNCAIILTQKGVIKGKYIFPYTPEKTKFQEGMVFNFSDETSPLHLMGVIRYSEDPEMQNSIQVTVSKYMSDIVVGSSQGIDESPQCAPYREQDFQWFDYWGGSVTLKAKSR